MTSPKKGGRRREPGLFRPHSHSWSESPGQRDISPWREVAASTTVLSEAALLPARWRASSCRPKLGGALKTSRAPAESTTSKRSAMLTHPSTELVARAAALAALAAAALALADAALALAALAAALAALAAADDAALAAGAAVCVCVCVVCVCVCVCVCLFYTVILRRTELTGVGKPAQLLTILRELEIIQYYGNTNA